MANARTRQPTPPASELRQMHDVYRRAGKERNMAPHVVYSDAACPHPGCGQKLQAIDFRLEAHGRAIHDPLVQAWWDDTGFTGRCPHCHGWVHFTIQAKRAIDADEAARLPQLPENWYDEAVVL